MFVVAHASSYTHRNVNDTPDTTFAILFEHSSNLVLLGQVTSYGFNFCAVLVFL